MGPRDDPFHPEHVDEQIEWLAQLARKGTQERNQSSRLVQHLQRYYLRKKQQDTLEHAWKYIIREYEDIPPVSYREERVRDKQRKPERSGQYHMQQNTVEMPPARKSFPRWGIMVAVIVIALLIGSTAIIMSRAAAPQGMPGTGGRPSTTCSATHTTGNTKPAGCVTPTTIPPTPMPTPIPPTPMPTPTVRPTPTQAPPLTPTVMPTPTVRK